MKLYIRAVTIKQLEEQYGKDKGMTKKKFKTLINLDPTADYDTQKRGKYGPWIMKQNRLGNLAEDDYDNLRDALGLFVTDYKHFQNPDINRYKTVTEFLEDSNRVGNRELSARELEKLHGKQAHKAGDKDKKFLCEDGDWELWTPLTYEGSIALARSGGGPQAEWCTAWTRSDNYYRSYTSRGPLYIFLNKRNTGEKYQTHLGSDGRNSWFYNAADREQGKDAFFAFLDQHPNFKEFFKVRDENGVKTMGESIVGYTADATEVIIPEGVTSIPQLRLPDSCKLIVLPDSVTKIADGAFKNTHLEAIEFTNVSTIGKEAFAGSTISEIDLSNVDLIDNYAFQDCNNLVSINIKRGAQLGAYAFARDENLTGTYVQYPETLLSSGTFNQCPNLTIDWQDDDYVYTIDGIKLLRVNMATHPQLVESNENYIDIQNI